MSKKLKVFALICFDVLAVSLSFVLSVFILQESLTEYFVEHWYLYVSNVVIAVGLSFAFGLYTSIMRYAGFSEMFKILCAMVCFAVFNLIIVTFSMSLNFNWTLLITFIYSALIFGSRFSYRFYLYFSSLKRSSFNKKKGKRVLVVGGGAAGALFINELINSDKTNLYPVCILDDDKKKLGLIINGVKVVGEIKDVKTFADKYDVDEIVIAMPSVSKAVRSKIISVCQESGRKIMTVPGLYEIAEGKVSVSSIKEVSIADLLGREQVKVNIDEIIGYIENKTVLVTGGGGSIGSELCRQIAAHNPKQLIIFDIYENNAYDIQQELIKKYPELNLLVLIGSVRDSKKVNNVFKEYKPDIVFHAAAHKHVPLMETSPNEAVKNNVSGTYKVADAAGRFGAEKFILISTDKAVNPTNIMGATKRICEMIVQTMDKKYETEYVAVRFGNVLGSNGSVIPLFKKQIQEGGPVTVTDKDIVRYFMTIPEAVSLVLQAGAYAKGGEIFVLDMGEPVRIYDLAVNLIKLSGLEPYKDIDIKITGLRPGEKLYEERLMEEEGLSKTANDMISIGKPLQIDEKNLFEKIQQLYVEAYNETDKMKELVHELVPTYKIDKRS